MGYSRLQKQILIVGLTVACSFMCLSASEWSMFKGNELRNGFYERKVGVPEKGAVPNWKITLGGAVVSSPAIDGGVIYIGSRDSSLYAVSLNNGRVLWRAKTGGWVDSSPVIHKDKVYVGSSDKNIYGIDRITGDIVDRYPAGIQLSSPLVFNDETLISGMGFPVKGITAYPINGGKGRIVETVWSKEEPQASGSSPAVSDNVVVIGNGNGMVLGKDAETGSQLWSFRTEGGFGLSSPALDQHRAYIAPGDYDTHVYMKEDIRNPGSALRKFAIGGPQGAVPASYLAKSGAAPLIHPFLLRKMMRLSPEDRQRALSSFENQGLRLNRVAARTGMRGGKVGTVNWIPTQGMKTSSVSVGKTDFYVIQKHLGLVETSAGNFEQRPYFILTAADKTTGQESWQFHRVRKSVEYSNASTPIVGNYLNGGEVVFFGWGDKMYALRNITEKRGSEPEILWENQVQGDIVSTPALSEGNLVFATMEGNLYSYPVNVAPIAGALKQGVFAYPNPVRKRFSPVSKIRLDLQGAAATVNIKIFNIADRAIENKTIKTNGAAVDFEWNVRNVPNGIYFAMVVVNYATGGIDSKWVKIAIVR